MPALSESVIATLLAPYLDEVKVPADLYPKLSLYLDLLLKWNARTNLTAVRHPEEIVRRHFGESLFAARHLAPETQTLLDFGSGAGFPGVPIALFHPDITVTLAESQNKKAVFLREAIRTLNIPAEVWSNRVEAMPEARRFDAVALRAVDNMTSAIAAAQPRATHHLLLLAGAVPILPPAFTPQTSLAIPHSTSTILFIGRRTQS